jgi:hypothetical protein
MSDTLSPKCSFCKKYGHTIFNCYNVICKNCNRKGHLDTYCTFKNRKLDNIIEVKPIDIFTPQFKGRSWADIMEEEEEEERKKKNGV